MESYAVYAFIGFTLLLLTLVLIILSIWRFKKADILSRVITVFTAIGLLVPFLIEAIYGSGDFKPMHYFVVIFTGLSLIITAISIHRKRSLATSIQPSICAVGYWSIMLFGEITAAV